MPIREAAVAGQFYPGVAGDLDATVRGLLADADATATADGAGAPKAIIAPHAGYIYSGALAARAYARLAPAAETITRVVLLGPCHRVAVRGLALSSAEAFRTPLGDIPLDRRSVEKILELPQVQVSDDAHELEHSLEVHLPFLQQVLGDFSLVPLVVGETSPDQVADVIEVLWGGPETVFVISTDLSHFLDYDGARKIDAQTCDAIENLDPSAITPNGACGRFPVGGMLVAARRRGMTISTLGICNSGDTAGTKDRVVGYGAWMLQEAQNDFGAATKALLARHGKEILKLAERSIHHGLNHGTPVPLGDDDQSVDLMENGACFVTLKKGGQLRGCIGSTEAYRPLSTDVVENAFRAAFKDPRFPALTTEELDGLELSVSVLSPQTPMTFTGEADFLGQLQPGVDGLIIEDAGRRALFLPSVWAQLPTPETFVEHLKRKAGMARDHWSDGFRAWRFTAEEIAAD
ncbi:MAG: AmmeMemoRadiSam system protein B [Alphaproteobacteria bacterium]|nr:AmmeMemoRadiSam system protein B [Alphaproteobacteria bacterium]